MELIDPQDVKNAAFPDVDADGHITSTDDRMILRMILQFCVDKFTEWP